ncbi:MAG: YcdB/YcdC domain-containing protein [Bacillota bacterium]
MFTTVPRSLKRAVVALLLLVLLPTPVLAGGLPAAAPGGEAAVQPKSLEDAIRTIKDNFAIPKELSRFSSGFNSWGNRPTWTMTWDSTDPAAGRLYAEVDAITGDIASVNLWRSDMKPGPKLPTISLAAAEEVATALVERLLPDRVKDLRLVSGQDQLVPLSSYGPVVYSVHWQRFINGTPVVADGVTVGVSADDGTIMNYRLDWSRPAYPAATGIVTPAKAREAFVQTGMFELQYFNPGQFVPLKAGQKAKVSLVYSLVHRSGGVIDAFTGQPVVLQSDMWFGMGGADGIVPPGMGARSAYLTAAQPTPLTPEELAEIEKTAKLITRDEAIAAVEKWVGVPAGLTLRGYSLANHWAYPDIRMWSLNWSNEEAARGQANYLSAEVNAVTGELIGFSLGFMTDPSAEAVLDRDGARKLAEDFLTKVQPEKFKQTRLTADQPPATPTKEDSKPRQQYFSYQRMVDGIPFPVNGLTITVDAVAQRVTGFNLNWANYEFPKAAGLLTAAQVNEAFLAARPLSLTYVQVLKRDGSGEGLLVYRPNDDPAIPSSTRLDAKTGEFVDGQGKLMAKQPRARRFDDIKGNFAEYEIGLLGRAGLFGEYGGSFHPAEKIGAASLLRAVLMAKDGLQQSDLTDNEVIAQAKQRGWITGDLAPTAVVTREMLAKLMVRFLDLDRAARIEGIFRVPYADAASIAPASLGYVAIAWGLGVVTGDGQSFAGSQPVTRAEAAAALVRTIRARP